MARKVVIVGFPGVQALDVVGPHDVFSTASLLTGGGYDVVVASADGQPVTTVTGIRAPRLSITCIHSLPAYARGYLGQNARELNSALSIRHCGA